MRSAGPGHRSHQEVSPGSAGRPSLYLAPMPLKPTFSERQITQRARENTGSWALLPGGLVSRSGVGPRGSARPASVQATLACWSPAHAEQSRSRHVLPALQRERRGEPWEVFTVPVSH